VKAHALMYHDVVDANGVRGGFEGDGPAVYAVTEAAFRAQLDAIEATGAGAPVRAESLVAGSASVEPWLLTFDDGGSSAVSAGSELARRSWPAHFFIVTDLVGTPGFVDWDGVRELAAQGHVIGSHSASHPDHIASCSPAELEREWSRSVVALSEAIGAPVTTASVPGGYYSTEVGRAAAAAGITCLFTSEPVTRAHPVEGYLLVGRYAVRNDTATADVAAAAAGRARPWLRQRVAWELRGIAKKAAGRHYRRLRAALLARR